MEGSISSLTLYFSRSVGGGGPVYGLNSTFEPVVYVYNATTGEEVTKCTSPFGEAGFVNDVTVVDGMVYATDSLVNTILAVDVEAALMNGTCQLEEIWTPPEVSEGFKAKGTTMETIWLL